MTEAAPKILLGQVVTTPAVSELMLDPPIRYHEVMDCLIRHSIGDWGLVPDEDKVLNDLAVENGDRVLSAYDVGDTRIWIITEADRSVTTVLLPDEY